MLAAATAAVFVCAPAGAIEITSISPSGSYWNPAEVVEHMNNMVEIRTDVDFKRVEWNLDGELKKTDNGTDTYSDFIPDLDGMGSTGGIRRYIEATAFDANGGSDTERIWIRVWRSFDKVNVTEMTGPNYVSEEMSYNIIVGESFTVYASTDVGFARIDWYLKEVKHVLFDEQNYGELMDSTYGPNYKASFTHTFGERDGSNLENGKAYRITAAPYNISESGESVEPAFEQVRQIKINVHEDKGKQAVSGHSFISLVHIAPKTHVVTVDWTHGITYYNDVEGYEAHLYAWLKLYEDFESKDDVPVAQFRSGDRDNGEEAKNVDLKLDRTFKGYVFEHFYKPMPGNFALIPGRKYRFAATQSLEDNAADDDWEDRENGGDTFWSQNWRYDPDDEFDEEDLKWVGGGNYVWEN